MFTNKLLTLTSLRLPQLAATVLICLSLGTNTHVDAANTSVTLHVAPLAQMSAQVSPALLAPNNIAQNMQVLSPKDVVLYRLAFTAQEKADWKNSDAALADINDRRLIGHVLADRYQRRPASATELQEWLTAYSNLPEAADIYDQAQRLPAMKGFKIAQLTDEWSGSDSYGTSFGFKIEANTAKQPSNTKHLTSAINRALRHGDPIAAKAVLDTEQKRHIIPANELANMKGRIAMGFLYEGQTDRARKLTDEVAASQNPLALWIGGMAAWKQNDMKAAGKSFAKLAALSKLAPWDRAAAGFWAYRALKHTGDTSQARYWLEQAAEQPRSFYGFLAAHVLGRDTAWSWQLPELNAKNIEVLAAKPAGWRALALVQIGQNSLAESELRHLNPQGHRALQEAMLAVAERTHMPSLAMQLGGIATNDNGKYYDAALYPLPPWQPEHGFQVDRALMYALMRHESQFDPTAVSGRGACGLMQLMPSTADLVANDAVPRDCSGRLLDPSYNMALGQKYVRHLASQPLIGDNLLLLLAAYNSGPTKLARWMGDDTRNDPLLFIESLPVRETREYVQQVLIHYWTYRARLSEPETSVLQLARGEWPRTTLRDERLLAKPIKAAQADGGFEVASNQP